MRHFHEYGSVYRIHSVFSPAGLCGPYVGHGWCGNLGGREVSVLVDGRVFDKQWRCSNLTPYAEGDSITKSTLIKNYTADEHDIECCVIGVLLCVLRGKKYDFTGPAAKEAMTFVPAFEQ
jgi:hypothetical protein